MRRKLALLLVTYALFGAAAASHPATGQPPASDREQGKRGQAGKITFTSHSELVLVPVLVRSAAGEPITALTKDQFEVRDEGSVRTISTFEEVKTTTAPPPAANGSARRFSNYLAGSEPRRVTIILLDFLNTDAPDQLRARQAVVDYLGSSLQADEPTAVLVLNSQGLHLVHSFSSSTATLIAAIRQAQAGKIQPGAVASAAPVSRVASPDAPDMVRIWDELHGVTDLIYAPQVAAITDLQSNSLKEYGIQLDTLRAMEMISQAYAGIPGRKSLVWVTAGFWLRFPTMRDVEREVMQKSKGGFDAYVPAPAQAYPGKLNDTGLRESTALIWKMLNASNISVYPVDVTGLKGYESIAGPVANERPQADRYDAQKYREFDVLGSNAQDAEIKDSYFLYAGATGGRTCVNDNDIRDCLRRAARDSAHFYLLGFYLPAAERKPGWHKLSVKLNAKYSDIRYRNGYLVDDRGDGRPAMATDPQSLLVAFASPVDYTGVPMDVTVTRIAASGDRNSLSLEKKGTQRKLSFDVSFPPGAFLIDRENNNRVELELSARAFDFTTGTHVGGFSNKIIQANLKPESTTQVSSEGLIHHDALVLAPGKYQLRVVVRDRLTGKMGSVTAPIDAN